MENHILYVDANEDNQFFMYRIIQHAGYVHHKALDHHEAWVAASREYFSMIIVTVTDETSAELFTFVRDLKSHPSMGHTPVIAAIHDKDSHLKEPSFLAGCDGHLPKPADIHQIQALLADTLPAPAQEESILIAAD